MGACNFKVGDESLIYVPNIFFGPEEIDFPDIIEEEVEFIISEVMEEVKQYLADKEVSFDGKLSYSISDANTERVIDITYYDDDYRYCSSIHIHFNPGYYFAGNISYKVYRNNYNPERVNRLIDDLCILIEKELEKYCHCYYVLGVASNGEAFYRKVK